MVRFARIKWRKKMEKKKHIWEKTVLPLILYSFFLNYARSTGPSYKTRQWAPTPTARSNAGEAVQLSGTRLLSNSLPNPPKHTHTHCSVSTGDKPRRSTRSIPMGFERGRVGSQPGDHTTGLSARLRKLSLKYGYLSIQCDTKPLTLSLVLQPRVVTTGGHNLEN
jgi:hypothetical protein